MLTLRSIWRTMIDVLVLMVTSCERADPYGQNADERQMTENTYLGCLYWRRGHVNGRSENCIHASADSDEQPDSEKCHLETPRSEDVRVEKCRGLVGILQDTC